MSRPTVKDKAWVKNPIDAFILSGLEEAGLTPAPPADKRTLARRAYFDRRRPAANQRAARSVRRATNRPDAWERLIDELLASPHYGEQWARHWLDLVRYAETNSFERDGRKPNAWKYRDYVIRCFNDDKPYDQFVREQLAGDELDEVTHDSIIATGYYRLGIWDDEPADPVQSRCDELDDLISTTSQVVSGAHRRLCPVPRSQDRSDPAASTTTAWSASSPTSRPMATGAIENSNSQWDHRSRKRRASCGGSSTSRSLRSNARSISMEEVGVKRMSAVDQTPQRNARATRCCSKRSWKDISTRRSGSSIARLLTRLDEIRKMRDELPRCGEPCWRLRRCQPRPEPHSPGRARQSARAGRSRRASLPAAVR